MQMTTYLSFSGSFTSWPRAARLWCRSRRRFGPRVLGWWSIALGYRGWSTVRRPIRR